MDATGIQQLTTETIRKVLTADSRFNPEQQVLLAEEFANFAQWCAENAYDLEVIRQEDEIFGHHVVSLITGVSACNTVRRRSELCQYLARETQRAMLVMR